MAPRHGNIQEYVRKRHYVDGWSIRELSKQLKIARQTVRKLLEDAEIPINIIVSKS